MAPSTLALTHYCPWDAEDHAVCGAPVADSRRHSTSPTCPACAAHLAAEDYCTDLVDALAAGTAPPLVAEVAAPQQRALPMSPMGADLFALAVKLNRVYMRVNGGRR